jgi:hypothetical protein
MVNVYEHLRSDVGSPAIKVYIKYRILCTSMIYLLAAGKWLSGIKALAPAATAARMSSRSEHSSKTNLRRQLAF